MKKTAFLLKRENDEKYRVDGTITCEVIGEMEDGSKVWKEVGRDKDDDSQYALFRNSGVYCFIRM